MTWTRLSLKALEDIIQITGNEIDIAILFGGQRKKRQASKLTE